VRYLCCLFVLAGLPVAAAAQHSPSLPSIGGPLPRIGLQPSWEHPRTPAWERPQTPAWERKNPPPWEPGHVPERVQREEHGEQHRRRQQPPVVYVLQPYPVEVTRREIVVSQPVTHAAVQPLSRRQREQIEDEIERIVEDRIRAYRDRVELQPPAATAPPPPPSVEPGASKTLYLIPGCYMGNVSPKDMRLPAGCDLSKLTTITP